MISAGAIIFTRTNEGVKYLLLKHKKTGTHWGFPKGQIENGENPEETALREAREETGIELKKFIKDFKLRDSYFFINREGIKIEKKVIYFLAESDEGKIKLSEEHSEIVWFSFEDALRLLDREKLKEILKRAQEKINSKK